MNLTFFIALLFALQIFYWLVGRRAAKGLQGQCDYFLAGRKVPLFPLTMTFLATQVGGGLVLGAAEEAYKFGWVVLLYPLGAALGLIVLGMGIGKKLAAFEVYTVAALFERVYRSVALRKIASTLSILSLFMILVAQIIASAKFLASLGLESTPLFVAFWAIVILYTVQGGLKAVISTDLVQATFFTLVFLGCMGFVLYSEAQLPPLELSSKLPALDKLCGWLLMPLLFMVIEQDMGQRCFAGSCPKTVSRATLLAAAGVLIVCTVPIFFGVLAKDLGLQVPASQSVLMAVVAATTGSWISAIVGCAILAAIISTATSLINAISSNLLSDFLQKARVGVAQKITALLGIGAIFFAFRFDNVVDLLIQSYELSVSCLFVPIFFALFKKRGEPLAAILALGFGAAGFFCFRVYPIAVPKEIASVLLSLLGFGCGAYFARLKNWVSLVE